MEKLLSKTIKMRLVNENDAEFILSLRLNDKYNKFLSKVSSSIEEQKVWIKNYQRDEKLNKQFYFIIETNDGKVCGTVRVYDIRDDSFCWGSWILNENKTRFSAVESAFLVYKFGFDIMKYKKSHFEVAKENKKVIDFHKKFGAIVVGEDECNYHFEITPDSINKMKEKFSSYIG